MDFINETSIKQCSCKKEHIFESEVIVGKGVVCQLPQVLQKFHAKNVFLLADRNTFSAAGKQVCEMLEEHGTSVLKFVYDKDVLEPDEKNTGLAFMHYRADCDLILAVGSGVINDIGKIVSAVTQKPYIIVATAPSMDGYASATSSMTVEGLKTSLNSKCADVIIGDVDILKTAPDHMLKAGLGDMLAKYISICEWRIAHEITGEYYCEEIARLVRNALKKCIDNAGGLLKRDDAAIKAVFEGLVICGLAMAYAGVSRPASGVEHYLSHVWDMRGPAFDTPVDLHGIQCAVGTYIAAGLYEKIKCVTPDREKARKYAASFHYADWAEQLREFIGQGAQSMIALEEKEQKYDVREHEKRIEIIIDKWEKILAIADEEIPSISELDRIYSMIDLPKTPGEIGLPNDITDMTFKASKDIRDKYVLSRLCWDLGILDEITTI